MIIVSGTVQIRADRRAEAIRVAAKMAETTQEEPGCLSYRFSADLIDPNLFYIFEEWESDEALTRHFGTDHMREFQQTLPNLLAGAPSIKRYDGARASVMM